LPRRSPGQTKSQRLSQSASRQFALAVRSLIDRYHLGSIDSIFPNVEYDRSTIHRWLTHRSSSIPIDGADAIVNAIRDWAPHVNDDDALRPIDDLIKSARAKSRFEVRLRSELRRRGVPVNRAIDALRAVSALPGSDLRGKDENQRG